MYVINNANSNIINKTIFIFLFGKNKLKFYFISLTAGYPFTFIIYENLWQ